MDSRKGKRKRTKGVQFMLENSIFPVGLFFCLFFRGMMNTDQTKFKTHREVVCTIKFLWVPNRVTHFMISKVVMNLSKDQGTYFF